MFRMPLKSQARPELKNTNHRNSRSASKTPRDGGTWFSWVVPCLPTWYVNLASVNSSRNPTNTILRSPTRRTCGYLSRSGRNRAHALWQNSARDKRLYRWISFSVSIRFLLPRTLSSALSASCACPVSSMISLPSPPCRYPSHQSVVSVSLPPLYCA